MKKVICTLLVVCMLVGLCGCTKTPYESKAEKVPCPVDPYIYDEVDLNDNFKNVTADFSMELFGRTYKEGENSLVSPLSVMLCLGMVGNGVAEDTLKEFEAVLGQELTMEDLNLYYATYRNMLMETSKGDLSIANSIWIRDVSEFVVKTEFTKKNMTYYDAQIYKAPFDGTTVNDINNWVKDNTNGMIPGIIDELSPEAMMVLLNALAFEGEWVVPYYETQVNDTDFTNIQGKIETVEGMYGTERVYIEDENTTGFIKNYKNGFSFVVFLPDEDVDFDEYVAAFTGEKYLNLVNNAENVSVDTMLPKFKYSYEASLNKTMMDMGIKSAFDSAKADFSEMFEANDALNRLYISEVIHKTYIEVGEKGTKAAAVTAVIMDGNSMPLENKKVICDRPFVYAIVDGSTMLPVFIGSISTIS